MNSGGANQGPGSVRRPLQGLYRSWLGAAMIPVVFLLFVHLAQSAYSQSPTAADEEIEIGLVFLPPRTSVEYATLRQLADAVSQAPLALPHGEIWKVKRGKFNALREAAKKVGATALAFGTAIPDATSRIEKSAKLDGLQQRLASAIGELASAVELNIVQATSFEVLGYTPLLGQEATTGTRWAIAKLKLALESGVEIIASRVALDARDEMLVWRGKIESTGELFNIYLGRAGMITGELRHGKFKYWIRPLGDGLLAVAKIDESRLPADHGVSDAQLFKKIEELAKAGSPQQQVRSMRFRDILGALPPSAMNSPPQPVMRDGPAEIDVMFVYTPKVAQNYMDIEFELIRPAIEQTNESFRNSGIPNVSVRLVHVHKTNYDEVGAIHFDHVWRMVDRGDGYMEEVPGLRDKHKADVVVLIVDSAEGGCGLATRIAPEAEEAYVVAHHECAALTYSVTHEIGHILGARHDRGVDKAASAGSYSHGYVEPGKQWRSMMAYKEGCDGCPRLPIWSSPIVSVRNERAGEPLADNARFIREQAGRVAQFR